MTDCGLGFFCHEKFALPSDCPEAYMCPNISVDIYTKCDNNYYCPQNTIDQTTYPCPPGMIGNGNPNDFDVPSSCEFCPAGTYTNLTTLGTCNTCAAGYICFSGASTPTPVNVGTDNGYQAPAGYYAGAGDTSLSECPVGTYNEFLAKSSIDDCLTCPEDSFNSQKAASECSTCGSTSKANNDSTGCVCLGANRKFVESKNICICKERFLYTKDGKDLSEEDGIDDCWEQVYPNCAGDETYDSTGENCVKITESCEDVCGGPGK